MNIDILKNSKNNIIFFGVVGSGKTFLINKLTNSSFKTEASGYSCTLKCQSAFSLFGDMLLIDFPGLGSLKNIHQHVTAQQEILKIIPFKSICFIVKWDNRYDTMQKDINLLCEIFADHIKNVIIIITHTDSISTKAKGDFFGVIETQYCEKIIYTELNTNPIKLINDLKKYVDKMQNQTNFVVRERDLLKSINPAYDRKVIDNRKRYAIMFEEIIVDFKKSYNPKDSNLNRALYFSLKDYKNELVENYKNELKVLLNNDNLLIYSELIMFQNQIYDTFLKILKC